MTFSRRRRERARRALIALFYAVILLVPAAVSQAAQPLTGDNRHDLTQALDKLAASHAAIAAMVTECNGGMIMVFACPAPLAGAKTASGCNAALDSCDLVAALHDTDAAIEDLQKALAK